ncbi:MAG: hypothetical protein M1818_007998 [Claussenomyces sp. TS43310]|nr:MAG: hypothetical protein M1818_007998 [Claussenomyces sp. TS43310]
MASVASPFRGAMSPNKRPFSKISGGTQPTKRMLPLNVGVKRARSTNNTRDVELSGLKRLTGFESGAHFVEATNATLNDEAKRSLRPNEDDSPAKKRRNLSRTVAPTCDPADGITKGFYNFTGSLCYRNSLFQSLCHTPKFVNWLLQYHTNDDCVSDDSDYCVTCAMRLLVSFYWDQSVPQKRLAAQAKHMHGLFSELGWRTHSANGHGDPDDQLGWILGQIRSEVPKSVFDKFDAFHNLILKSEIKCERCGYASTSDGNEERLLSIPIRPKMQNSTLSAYISNYMEELIHDYTCEKCKHKSNKHRKQRIVYAPDVLLVQLKRFNHLGQKDSLKVIYGSDLDLSRFSADADQGLLQYRLRSVISHWGSTGGGHYISMTKMPTRGEWYEFDDDAIQAIDVSHALDPAKSSSGFTPYLLFYERKPGTIPE